MIGLLLILGLLAGLVSAGSTAGEDTGSASAPPAGTLQRVEVHRTGGIAYQELDEASEPPELAAFVDALDEALE